jgi:hypothetical protein
LGPLGKIICSDQELSVSFVISWEGPCYIDGYPFEQGPDIVLMHLVLIPGSGAMTGCTGVALPAPLCNIGFYVEPVVPLLDLIQGLVDTEVTS